MIDFRGKLKLVKGQSQEWDTDTSTASWPISSCFHCLATWQRGAAEIVQVALTLPRVKTTHSLAQIIKIVIEEQCVQVLLGSNFYHHMTDLENDLTDLETERLSEPCA